MKKSTNEVNTMNKKHKTTNVENEQGRECGICEKIMPIEKGVITMPMRTDVLIDSSCPQTIKYNGQEVTLELFCCGTCGHNLSNKVIGPNRQDVHQYIDAIVFFNEQKRKIKAQIKADIHAAYAASPDAKGFKKLTSGELYFRQSDKFTAEIKRRAAEIERGNESAL